VTSLLIGFLLVLLVPLFVATWRGSLLGLALQGCLLYAMSVRLHGAHLSLDGVVGFVDLVVVRGGLAPLLLYRVLRARRAPDRNDVLPPNMLAWAAAIGLVLLALRVAAALVPQDGDEQLLVAAVVSAVFLGFLVLATQVGVFRQIVGALRLENAVALFELGSGGPHEGALAAHLGQLGVLVTSILLFRWYLARTEIPAAALPEEPSDGEFLDALP
jgi:hydrogenase-4 membrane subunit HyfE